MTDLTDFSEQARPQPGVVSRDGALSFLDILLQPSRFKDYAPNGLQVEGKAEIRKIVSGVTACRALIEAAIAAKADAILVHHGLFWRGHDGRVQGWLKQRLAFLLAHDINLLAYHLPLDAHPTLGNNAQLGRLLGLQADARFGDQDLGWIGGLAAAVQDGLPLDQSQAAPAFVTLNRLSERVASRVGHAVVCVGDVDMPIRRIAWCTGGAQGYFEAAIAAGAQAFITGEISEPQAHLARECGVAFLACGHHASERGGAPAVAENLAAQFGLVHEFIDIPNPA
jgi:dinuclear metal center YbgI/SA1388 family protein